MLHGNPSGKSLVSFIWSWRGVCQILRVSSSSTQKCRSPSLHHPSTEMPSFQWRPLPTVCNWYRELGDFSGIDLCKSSLRRRGLHMSCLPLCDQCVACMRRSSAVAPSFPRSPGWNLPGYKFLRSSGCMAQERRRWSWRKCCSPRQSSRNKDQWGKGSRW